MIESAHFKNLCRSPPVRMEAIRGAGKCRRGAVADGGKERMNVVLLWRSGLGFRVRNSADIRPEFSFEPRPDIDHVFTFDSCCSFELEGNSADFHASAQGQ
jgi:hypothetical protein